VAGSCSKLTPKNGNKTANINVKNFHRSLTTVVRAQHENSKSTDTMFNRKR